jgi:hypothetical protein
VSQASGMVNQAVGKRDMVGERHGHGYIPGRIGQVPRFPWPLMLDPAMIAWIPRRRAPTRYLQPDEHSTRFGVHAEHHQARGHVCACASKCFRKWWSLRGAKLRSDNQSPTASVEKNQSGNCEDMRWSHMGVRRACSHWLPPRGARAAPRFSGRSLSELEASVDPIKRADDLD